MTSPQPLPPTTVYTDPISARARLYELGLVPELLWKGLNYGLGERRNLTAHDPNWLVGILTSGKIIRGLRDQLVPAGWTTSDDLNYATVVHPDGHFQIAVSSADVAAGNPFGNPSTRAEKGIATELAVESNQVGFYTLMPADFPAPQPTRKRPTFLFLYNIDDETGIVGAELALPIAIGDDRLIRKWQERIPLFATDISTAPKLRDRAQDDGANGDDIHIEIERRAN